MPDVALGARLLPPTSCIAALPSSVPFLLSGYSGSHCLRITKEPHFLLSSAKRRLHDWMIQRDRANTPPMAMKVVEFSREGYKIREIFGLKSMSSKENYHVLWIEIVASCQKVTKSDFQSQFSKSKIKRFFLILFHIWEYQFRSTFFVNDIFWYINF